MGRIGKEIGGADTPRPIKAPDIEPERKEIPGWLDPNKKPEREPVKVRKWNQLS